MTHDAAQPGEPDARLREHESIPELERLERAIGRFDRAIVAFSGGVDSALVAAAAWRVLGEDAVAVTGLSPSLAADDRVSASALAADIGLPHRELETHEIDDPRYRANAGNRCYFCKSELYSRLAELRREEGFDVVLDGTNTDDLGDTRPGLMAARERDVISPLVEAGLDKAAVRRLSRHLGLPTWDRPENACLASRLPIGTVVSVDRLQRVESAERSIRQLGFRQLRVRDLGETGRVEIDRAELALALEPPMRARIEAAVVAAGFASAHVDPQGYRRGGADRTAPEGFQR